MFYKTLHSFYNDLNSHCKNKVKHKIIVSSIVKTPLFDLLYFEQILLTYEKCVSFFNNELSRVCYGQGCYVQCLLCLGFVMSRICQFSVCLLFLGFVFLGFVMSSVCLSWIGYGTSQVSRRTQLKGNLKSKILVSKYLAKRLRLIFLAYVI